MGISYTYLELQSRSACAVSFEAAQCVQAEGRCNPFREVTRNVVAGLSSRLPSRSYTGNAGAGIMPNIAGFLV